MELNWTTFILEVVNFLVLVWLLKRFFYQPVQRVIAKRRSAIEKSMADADAIRADAEALKAQYNNRLADWEKEHKKAREAMHAEIEAERSQLHQALEAELEARREKARVLEKRRRDAERHEAEAAAWTLADGFLRKLLQDVAGPELEARIVELACRGLDSLPEAQDKALAEAWAGQQEVRVQTTFPLSRAQQQALRAAFEKRLGSGGKTWKFTTDETLIAGLHTSIGAWTLAANLRDEMRLFLESDREQP